MPKIVNNAVEAIRNNTRNVTELESSIPFNWKRPIILPSTAIKPPGKKEKKPTIIALEIKRIVSGKFNSKLRPITKRNIPNKSTIVAITDMNEQKNTFFVKTSLCIVSIESSALKENLEKNEIFVNLFSILIKYSFFAIKTTMIMIRLTGSAIINFVKSTNKMETEIKIHSAINS